MQISLTERGLDNTLKIIIDNLEKALGSGVSKKTKDMSIYRAIGALDAIYQLTSVTDGKPKSKAKSNNDGSIESGILI